MYYGLLPEIKLSYLILYIYILYYTKTTARCIAFDSCFLSLFPKSRKSVLREYASFLSPFTRNRVSVLKEYS